MQDAGGTVWLMDIVGLRGADIRKCNKERICMREKVLKWLPVAALFTGSFLHPADSIAQGSIVQNGAFNSPDGMSIPGWTYPGYMSGSGISPRWCGC